MSHIAMAYIVMACVAIAYLVMAYPVMAHGAEQRDASVLDEPAKAMLVRHALVDDSRRAVEQRAED